MSVDLKMDFSLCLQRTQRPISTSPYDSWIAANGSVIAEFHRNDSGFLVRFPSRVDFEIDIDGRLVRGWPAKGSDENEARTVFENSIIPIIGNHFDGLFLHGSAVCFEGQAVAFIGPSRSGKTTLAGCLAKQGFPILTEDVIDLTEDANTYWVEPKASPIRLFPDSARILTGVSITLSMSGGKVSLPSSDKLPFAKTRTRLRAFFMLGSDDADLVHAYPLSAQASLALLLPQSFVLDVEDKTRLRAHFNRLANLVDRVPCFALDYPRDYGRLPEVAGAIIETCQAMENDDHNQ